MIQFEYTEYYITVYAHEFMSKSGHGCSSTDLCSKPCMTTEERNCMPNVDNIHVVVIPCDCESNVLRLKHYWQTCWRKYKRITYDFTHLDELTWDVELNIHAKSEVTIIGPTRVSQFVLTSTTTPRVINFIMVGEYVEPEHVDIDIPYPERQNVMAYGDGSQRILHEYDPKGYATIQPINF